MYCFWPLCTTQVLRTDPKVVYVFFDTTITVWNTKILYIQGQKGSEKKDNTIRGKRQRKWQESMDVSELICEDLPQETSKFLRPHAIKEAAGTTYCRTKTGFGALSGTSNWRSRWEAAAKPKVKLFSCAWIWEHSREIQVIGSLLWIDFRMQFTIYNDL